MFWHRERELFVIDHVDDFLRVGPAEGLRWMKKQRGAKFELKGNMLERGEPIQILGRDIAMADDGYNWAGDEKHVKILTEELGPQGANGVAVPLGREDRPSPTTDQITDDDQCLSNDVDAKLYRRGAARINYMALDRPNLGFAANMLSRQMARPRKGGELLLKRMVRYLVSHPKCELLYR